MSKSWSSKIWETTQQNQKKLASPQKVADSYSTPLVTLERGNRLNTTSKAFPKSPPEEEPKASQKCTQQ
jgi:hypothetical protein